MKLVKRLALFISVFLSFPSAAYAGDDSGMSARLGPRAALGWSAWFRGEGVPGQATAGYKQSFYFGFSSYLDGYDLAWVRIGVQPEVLFVRRGTVLEFEGSKLDEHRMNYLDVPVLVRSLLRIPGPTSLYAIVGPRIGFLLNAQRTDVNGNVQELNDFDRIDVGASVGIGLAFAFTSRYHLILEGRYDQGFTNFDDGLGGNTGLRHRAIFLAVGLDMELWRQDTSIHDRAVSP